MASFPLKLYVVACLCFLAIDMLWLRLLAVDFYRAHLGPIMALRVNLVAALLVYLLLVAGLIYFVILPSLAADLPLLNVALRAAFFGVVAYGTYDLTNHATLRDWTTTMTLVDMAWGGFVCAATAVVSYLIAPWLR